ncbi:hypothetical protein ABPG75_000512 [Micractinium tetrahymenae]
MSRSYFASQYDAGYRPKALGNWEEPDKSKVVRPGGAASPALKTEDGRTIPIVNEKGHIVRGSKKPAAFTPAPPVYAQSPARWPQPNPAIKGTAAATMGYKGIVTDYLPTSTVPLHTVEVEGCKEFNFR